MRSTWHRTAALIALLAPVTAAGAPDSEPSTRSSDGPHDADSLGDSLFGSDDPFAAAGFAAETEIPPPLLQATQESEQRRRTMLTLHQASGFATWGAMATSTVLGVLNIRDLYGAGDRSGRYIWPHRISTYTLTGLYLTTAGLALLAPTPHDDEMDRGFDAADVHRTLVSVASAGMVAQIALGFISARRAEAGNRRGIRRLTTAHQVVGFATMASLTGAALTWVF